VGGTCGCSLSVERQRLNDS